MWADERSWGYCPSQSIPVSTMSVSCYLRSALHDLRTLSLISEDLQNLSIYLILHFFLVGLFHTFSSSLFFCPLAIPCFSVVHLTGMMDFKNWLLILTSRTQPRTLNQASLHSTVAPLIYHSSTLLYPPSALTWPHLASSRVLYNTEHSTNICYIKQKQWLGNKQDKHNGMIMWHIAEDKMDPSSIGGGHQEDTTTSWIMSWTWAIRGSLPLPCPWNMVSPCLPLSQRLL